jgi:hypothetical protein
MKHLTSLLIFSVLAGNSLVFSDTQDNQKTEINSTTTDRDILLANKLMDQFERTGDLQNLIDAARQMKFPNGPFDDPRYQTGLRREEVRTLLRIFSLVYANKDVRLSDSEKADLNFFIGGGSITGDDVNDIKDPKERPAAILKLKKKAEIRKLLSQRGTISTIGFVMQFVIPIYLPGLYSNKEDLKELKELTDETKLPENVKTNLYELRVPTTGPLMIWNTNNEATVPAR